MFECAPLFVSFFCHESKETNRSECTNMVLHVLSERELGNILQWSRHYTTYPTLVYATCTISFAMIIDWLDQKECITKRLQSLLFRHEGRMKRQTPTNCFWQALPPRGPTGIFQDLKARHSRPPFLKFFFNNKSSDSYRHAPPDNRRLLKPFLTQLQKINTNHESTVIPRSKSWYSFTESVYMSYVILDPL